MTLKLARTHQCRFGISTCKGCPGTKDASHEQQSVSFGDKVDGRWLLFQAMASSSIPGLASPSAYRSQMASNFIASCCPFEVFNMEFHNQGRTILHAWFEPRGDAMTTAADSLLLMTSGDAQKDLRLLQAGVAMYHSAVVRLRRELLRSDHQDSSLLGTVDLLRMCGQYEDIKSDWKAHSRGLLDMFRVLGPEALDKSTFSAQVFANSLHVFVSESMGSRQAIIFGQPSWQRAIAKAYNHPRFIRLTALACRMPALMQKADELKKLPHPPPLSAIIALLRKLEQLSFDFRNWLLARYALSAYQQPYWTSEPHQHEQPAFLTDKYPFPKSYEYHSLIDALYHIHYWGLSLILRQTILDVASLTNVPLLRPNFTATQQSRFLVASCREAADSVCMTIPYIYRQAAGRLEAVVLGMCAPLRAAFSWYARSCSLPQEQWCHNVLTALQDPGKYTAFPQNCEDNVFVHRVFGGYMSLVV